MLATILNHFLGKTSEESEETVQILRNSFIADNCLTSLSSLEEMNKFIEGSQKILFTGHFNFKCWQLNYFSPIIQELTPETTLVLSKNWQLRENVLTCKIEQLIDVASPLTKRKLLTVSQKVFDPVGYTAPVTLIHKVIFQKTLNLKLNRDDELSSSLVKSFKLWLRHLPASSQVQISRSMAQHHIRKQK